MQGKEPGKAVSGRKSASKGVPKRGRPKKKAPELSGNGYDLTDGFIVDDEEVGKRPEWPRVSECFPAKQPSPTGLFLFAYVCPFSPSWRKWKWKRRTGR